MALGSLPRDSGARSERAVAAERTTCLLVGAVLAACILLAYLPGLRAPFVFDDIGTIAGNDSLRHGWPSLASLKPPSGGITVTGRPLLNSSFAANYAFGGLAPWGYHLGNLAIHILGAWCLFGLLRRTLADRPPMTAWAMAAGATLLWALHPLQSESVTYLSQRAESMMGLCYLFTLYAFRRGADGGSPAWWVASIAACLCGMGTKEVMVSAPVAVLLYDRCFVSGGCWTAINRRPAYYGGLLLTWALLAFEVIQGHGRGGTLGFGLGLSWPAYVYGQCEAIAHYLRLALWPSALVFDYGVVAPGPLVGHGGLGLLATCALAGATVVAWFRKPALGFMGIVFFAILAPTSLVPGNRQTWAEHRMYLALVPLCVGAALATARWAPRAFWWIVGPLGIILGAVTFARNMDYRSAETLWSDTARKAPGNVFAWYNLGEARLADHQTGPAIEAFRAALAINPAYPQAHNNLGNALALAGDSAGALQQFSTAVALDPRNAEMNNNLGNALLQAKRYPEADDAFSAAAAADPSMEAPHLGMAQSLIEEQDLAAAQSELQVAARLAPDDPLPHARLARVWMTQGRAYDALEQFRVASRIAPDDASTHYNLANALAGSGQYEEAIAEYATAIRLNPGDALTHYSFGTALLLAGDRSRAKQEYESALRIDPGLDRARDRLRWLATH